jgi:hypothetical protein
VSEAVVGETGSRTPLVRLAEPADLRAVPDRRVTDEEPGHATEEQKRRGHADQP